MASGKKRRKIPGCWALALSAEQAMDVLRDSPQCASMLRLVHQTLLKDATESEAFGRDLLDQGFLRLLSTVLRETGGKRTTDWVEILGALSMSSLGSHRIVVSDRIAMSAFVEIFSCSNDVELLTSASHVLVDLLVTLGGREAFKSSAVLRHLLLKRYESGEVCKAWLKFSATEIEIDGAKKGLKSELNDSERARRHLLCRISDVVTSAEEIDLASLNHISNAKADWGESSPTGSNARESSWKSDVASENERATSKSKDILALKNMGFSGDCDDLIDAVLAAVKALLRDLGNDTIPKDVTSEGLQALVRLWRKILLPNRQLSVDSLLADTEERKWTGNHQTRHLVAACIVQMAMVLEDNDGKNWSECQCLFESTAEEMDHFLKKHWEQTPLLMKSKVSPRFLKLLQPFKSLEWMAKNFLAGCVSCPPTGADELNPSDLFESVQRTLGEPMIYGQDIRMVKTVSAGLATSMEDEEEVQFTRNDGVSQPGSAWHVHTKDILQAVEQGYTIAIKGMERRCSEVAEAATCLSKQLGQPSIGVNLYLTPLNEQGLDIHFDDHCVFVCQLVGSKKWNVYEPVKTAPRLYASRAFNRSVSTVSNSTRFDLEEGDILYIPRGSPHMARASGPEIFFKSGQTSHEPTEVDEPPAKKAINENLATWKESESNPSSSGPSFSLHLTFGAEVEPPFEWEGMVHIALRIWAEERWSQSAAEGPDDCSSERGSYQKLERVCEWLLQIAINILGDRDQAFRKGCLASAGWLKPSCNLGNAIALATREVSSLCGSEDTQGCTACDVSELAYFQKLVEKVANQTNLYEALSLARGLRNFIESCPESRLSWLRHISHCERRDCGASLNAISSLLGEREIEELTEGCSVLEIERTFMRIKFEFGRSRTFHQATDAYRCLWNKYHISRIQVTSGMLTLHQGGAQCSERFQL